MPRTIAGRTSVVCMALEKARHTSGTENQDFISSFSRKFSFRRPNNAAPIHITSQIPTTNRAENNSWIASFQALSKQVA